MTKSELWQKINKEASFLINLRNRWQCEKQYEDINEYLAAIQKRVPQAYEITKRPFGIKIKGIDGNLKVDVVIKGNKGWLKAYSIEKKGWKK